MNDIKVIATDVDGTLTNGDYLVSSSGDISKNFNTRDFEKMIVLAENNYHIVLITGSNDGCIENKLNHITKFNGKIISNLSEEKRCKEILLSEVKKEGGIYLYSDVNGSDLKYNKIKEFLSYLNYDMDNLLYFGDSYNDLRLIEESGFSICPRDSVCAVKDKADKVSMFNGGSRFFEKSTCFLTKNFV